MKIDGGRFRGAALAVLLSAPADAGGPGDASEALWTRLRRPQHGGAETVDSLTFTLREESGDWRILEIRSSR